MYSTKRLKLTTGFRIFTSFISLILFLFSRVQGIYHDNAFIITMLLLANFIIIVAQREESSNIYSFLLWIVEVSGIVCILWFTGGIYSLYFWLIFNPMLMMVNKNTKIIVTQHVLFVIAIFSLAYFAPEIAYVNHKTQTLIGVIVIVLYSYIIGAIYREQYVSNQKLLSTTKKLTKLSQKYAILNDCIIEFVTVLERIALVEKYDTILEAFKDYVAIVFQNDGFFITLRQDDTEICFAGSAEENSLLQNIIAQLSNDSDAVQSIVLSEKQLFYFYIKYENQQHIIGCFTDSDEHNHEIAQRQLMFLRQLYQLALNKLNVYSLNSELLIKNEQNRIAEEIHDGVNQELFAISCQLYNIKEKAMRGLSEDELIGRIEQVYDMIKTTNRQLKDIVYRMSKAKTTHTTLMTELTQFIDQLSFLYGVELSYAIDPAIIDTTVSIQKSILRILNETISNAVRHGAATKIDIKVAKNQNEVSVVVSDNGKGMALPEIEKNISGIGLKNLKHMADSHGGKVDIIPNERGTTINVTMLQGIAV